jgi:hypothetical protein
VGEALARPGRVGSWRQQAAKREPQDERARYWDRPLRARPCGYGHPLAWRHPLTGLPLCAVCCPPAEDVEMEGVE